MTDPIAVLRAHGGVARWRTLINSGVSSSSLGRAVETEQILHCGYGVYSLPQASQRRREMYLAGGAAACLTAAQDRGFWVLSTPTKPHLAIDRGGTVPGFIKHRAKLPLSDLDVLLQVLRCAEPLEALVVLTSAVRQRRVQLPELQLRIRGQRDQKARSVLARVDVHAESPLEVASRYRLEEAGFVVSSQVFLAGMGRMDQCVNGVLALELMGKEFHLSESDFTEDLRRFNMYTLRGFPVLRVGYALVVHRPAEFVDLVRRALNRIYHDAASEKLHPGESEHSLGSSSWSQ
ncbi:hypothetical protein FHU41_000054 [Psychromicrobium silvestre]|uniref:DUF559 domain-containing protein n=1 Tax=Psychromicrobium silvestre TaxID=1645614 RepID=A0A7Y9LQP6_9MICC|nr:hypothetical protein [Psychromicrobium silvestre]NYE93833.1 hypothetical protein [Psychromicrobium silvestre]